MTHDVPICTWEAAHAAGLDIAPSPGELNACAESIVRTWGDRSAEPEDEVGSTADAGAQLARALPLVLAELERVRAERDRYRSCWQSARERAAAYGEGILRIVHDRESYQGWLKTAENELAKAKTENAALQKRLHDAAMTRTWKNEDGKKFVFVEDIAPALLGTNPRA